MSKTVEYIQSKSKGIQPKVGIILGSGLGSFVDGLEILFHFHMMNWMAFLMLVYLDIWGNFI